VNDSIFADGDETNNEQEGGLHSLMQNLEETDQQ